MQFWDDFWVYMTVEIARREALLLEVAQTQKDIVDHAKNTRTFKGAPGCAIVACDGDTSAAVTPKKGYVTDEEKHSKQVKKLERLLNDQKNATALAKSKARCRSPARGGGGKGVHGGDHGGNGGGGDAGNRIPRNRKHPQCKDTSCKDGSVCTRCRYP